MERQGRKNPLLADRQKGFNQYDIRQQEGYYPLEAEPCELEKINYKMILSKVGWALFLMAIATLGSQVLISYFASYYIPEVYHANWFGVLLSALSVIGIGYPLFILVIRKVPDLPHGEREKLSFKQLMAVFFICAAFTYITNFITSIITLIITMFRNREVVNPVENMIINSNLYLNFAYATLVGPVMEEIIFRKYLVNKLRRFGDLVAILFSGLAFGLFHMNISQFLYAASLGFIFAYVAIRTNTIRYTIILHMLFNFIGSVAVPLIAFSGNKGLMSLLYVWVFGSTITGLLLINRNKDKIILEQSKLGLERTRDYIRYSGTILYIMTCLGMVVYFLLL